MPAPIKGGAVPLTKAFGIPRSVVGGAFFVTVVADIGGSPDHVVAALHVNLLEVDALSWSSLQVGLLELSHILKDSVVASVLPNEHQL